MLSKFERYPLTFGPTPIEKLSRLTAHLGGDVEIFAKREDCNSGLAFGGNKLRKLEYIVPDAISSNADTLVSIGGVQSNHTRMVAAVAAKIGMKCRLIQESWVPHEDAVYDRVGNIMLSRIMGADIQLVDEGFDIGHRESWTAALADGKAKGGKPYAIPAGASVHKFGGLGYVGFAEEVRAQEKAMGVKFEFIVVCTVTGSTHAGMVVGFCADGRERNVIGIDASCTPAQTKAQVLDIAQKTSALVGGKDITADDIVLLEDYAYPIYGVPSKETIEAIRLSARLEGMITDPVYEGKSMQGMIDLVQKGFSRKGPRCSTRIWGVPRRSMVTATRSVMAEMKMPSERKSSLWCIPRSQQSVLVAFRVLFGVGPGARSASKSDPSPPIATHCIDELIVCPTRVTVGSRWGSNRKPIHNHLGVEGYGVSSGGGRHDNASRSSPSRGSLD